MEQGGHLAWKESAVREAQRLQVLVAKEGFQPDNFFIIWADNAFYLTDWNLAMLTLSSLRLRKEEAG